MSNAATNDAAADAPLRKICLLVMQAGADDLADCVTPLMHALTASAMEAEVEVYFIGPCVRLLAEGVAQTVIAVESKKPLAILLGDAHESGIRLYACTSAWKAHVPDGAALAAQCAGFGGAATYLGRALDPAWRVLSY